MRRTRLQRLMLAKERKAKREAKVCSEKLFTDQREGNMLASVSVGAAVYTVHFFLFSEFAVRFFRFHSLISPSPLIQLHPRLASGIWDIADHQQREKSESESEQTDGLMRSMGVRERERPTAKDTRSPTHCTDGHG